MQAREGAKKLRRINSRCSGIQMLRRHSSIIRQHTSKESRVLQERGCRHGFAVTLPVSNLSKPTYQSGLHMTKRKHAAKPATALKPTAPVAKALSPNCLHLDTSANPSAEKKAKISGHSDKAVSGHTAGEGLDIDDIFEQARHKKHVPVKTQQGSKAVTKTPRVVGSKDDLFGTGQPKQRRYHAEGLPVYTPEELNVGAGGETDKCPFDCDCCY